MIGYQVGSSRMYKQFGYRQGSMYDRSHLIEEQKEGSFVVVLDFYPRFGDRVSGHAARTTKRVFPTLLLAQQYLTKKG